jgi:hypothetical protein
MTVRFCHTALTICLIFSLLSFFERPAYAYVDPGSGILAYQAISAFFAGTFFFCRRRIRNMLQSLRISRKE